MADGANQPLARTILVARLLGPSAWSNIEKQTSNSCKRKLFFLNELHSLPVHVMSLSRALD